MNLVSQQLQTVDLFDRLPDEMVRTIFNKLHDAKSLCLSMAVCKRFHLIAPQIDEIFLHIPKKKVKETDQETQKGFFKGVVLKNLIKPINFIAQMMKPRSKNDENDENLQSFHVPNDALKSFDEIRKLHLRLPCYGSAKLGSKTGKKTQNQNPTSFLKWKAEFGRELQSCVLLGAKSVSELVENEEKSAELRIIAEEELKLRIVWTISCLIAASARHYLVQDAVKSQKVIENVVVSDESDQGMVCMNKEQIKEVKEFKGKEDESEYRSRIPALKMKMWYMEKLELPGSGKVMEGATLVVIRPAGSDEDVKGRSETELVDGVFGEGNEGKVLAEAVKKLMVAKKCYTLEMNSF